MGQTRVSYWDMGPVGSRTIGHRTIGHRTIGHRTIGHTDDWSYGRLVIGPTGHRSYRRWDYRRLSKAKTKQFLKYENYLLDHFTVKYVIQNTNNTLKSKTSTDFDVRLSSEC